jgi:hypothetical protein
MDPANTTTRFRGTMEGVRLLDVVQLCCRTAATGCLEVKNGRNRGVLWFRSGEIVHAESGALRGEEAALTVLTWRYGDFTLMRNMAAPATSITTHWEGLVMRAACALDEHPVRPEEAQQGSERPLREEQASGGEAPAGKAAADPSTPGLPAESGTGETGEQEAALVNLGQTVHQLARDIGETLGLGSPVAVYGWGAGHRVSLEIGEDGSARLSKDPLRT